MKNKVIKMEDKFNEEVDLLKSKNSDLTSRTLSLKEQMKEYAFRYESIQTKLSTIQKENED